jgi:hypothetical protein
MTYFHGELNITKCKEVPSGARVHKDYKLADSETTGNHHMLEKKEGVALYEKDGVLYVKNDVPCDVYCVVKERHDNITLEPGIWEVDRAKEFDYLRMEKRNVAD